MYDDDQSSKEKITTTTMIADPHPTSLNFQERPRTQMKERFKGNSLTPLAVASRKLSQLVMVREKRQDVNIKKVAERFFEKCVSTGTRLFFN